MASVKLGTLIIRTLAKPISNTLKTQAKQHDRFRAMCISLAQGLHRGEVKLRTSLLGEPAKNIRPLSETRAIENGANALAEGFLFGVAALLIIGETWRSSHSNAKRRDHIDDSLEDLTSNVQDLQARLDTFVKESEERWEATDQRNAELTRILERIVEFGMRGGWAQFEDNPIQLPAITPATIHALPHLQASIQDRPDVPSPPPTSSS